MEEDKKPKVIELFEDTNVVIDCPYNTPLKHFFDSENWKVIIIKENGGETIIRIRQNKIK